MIKGVPSYASPFEAGMYLAVETERSFAEMMQNIGIEELHSFEENGAVVLEADAAEASKEKKANVIIQWLSARWEDIKGLINQGLEVVKKLIESAKKKISELLGAKKANFVDAVNRIKNTTDKEGKKKIFGIDYTWAGFDIANNANFQAVNYTFNDFATRAAESKGDINYAEEKEKLEEKIASKLNISGGLSISAIQKSINDTMRGEKIEVDIDYLKKNAEKIFERATEYNTNVADVSKYLNNTKKAFEDAKKAIRSAARKDRSDENLSNAAGVVKREASMFAAVSGRIVGNLRERTSNAIKLVLKVAISAKNKKEEVKATGESAIVPSSFQTELASLFNF